MSSFYTAIFGDIATNFQSDICEVLTTPLPSSLLLGSRVYLVSLADAFAASGLLAASAHDAECDCVDWVSSSDVYNLKDLESSR